MTDFNKPIPDFNHLEICHYNRLQKGKRKFVSPQAQGSGNASCWKNSCNDLQGVIHSSQPGDEIWVAKGVYIPKNNQSFHLKEGVKLYGGFSGKELHLKERNINENETILQGNGASVILQVSDQLSGKSKIDGFLIKNGHAKKGGGVFLSQSSPQFVNCTIQDNFASSDGGGVFINESHCSFVNCKFVHNHAEYYGGGVFVNSGIPKFFNCLFYSNKAVLYGGAIDVTSGKPSIVNCRFNDNLAQTGEDVYEAINTSPIPMPVDFTKETNPLTLLNTEINSSLLRRIKKAILKSLYSYSVF